MEKQGSKACTDQSYLDGKSLTVEVGVDQNRYQDWVAPNIANMC